MSFIRDGVEGDLCKMISLGLEYELMDLALAMNGTSFKVESSRKNEITGLYPFMTGAMSPHFGLADVYMMAMVANASILKRN